MVAGVARKLVRSRCGISATADAFSDTEEYSKPPAVPPLSDQGPLRSDCDVDVVPVAFAAWPALPSRLESACLQPRVVCYSAAHNNKRF
jgi:hypothetical protein